MSTPDHGTAIRDDSQRLRSVLGSADPDLTVPSCPDWTVDDLVWHLAEVQWFWATVVARRLDSPGDAEAGKPPRPDGHDDLLDLSAVATDRLLGALADIDDDEPVWSWNGAGTGAWVRRRQAHEALIHRVDAELVTGVDSHLDPVLAADGVDEVLTEMFGLVPAWGRFVDHDHHVVVATTDVTRAWHVSVGRWLGTSPRSGRAHDRPVLHVVTNPDDRRPEVSTAVTGPASDLDRWLWSRTGEDALELDGDPAVLAAFRAIVNDGIQ